MVTRGQQAFRVIHPRVDPKLVWRHAEQSFKLPDEVKRGYSDVAGHIPDRQRFWQRTREQFACPAEAAKCIRSDKHALP
jgi:hypothetical protein